MTRKRLDDLARTIIDSNRYMALRTADPNGHPWVSPVWFASEDYLHFLWVSSPDARHLQNIARRPEIAIFDSTVPVGAQAAYMSRRAEELTPTGLERAIELFARLLEADVGGRWELDDVQPPSLFRVYRATVSEHYVLIPGGDPVLGTGVDSGEPVTPFQTRDPLDGRRHDDEGMGCRGRQRAQPPRTGSSPSG